MIKSVTPIVQLSRYERTVKVLVRGTNDRQVPVAAPATGYRTETGEPFEREEVIEIVIDVPAIVRDLGRKAIKNSTGMSRDGHVVVRYLPRKHTES